MKAIMPTVMPMVMTMTMLAALQVVYVPQLAAEEGEPLLAQALIVDNTGTHIGRAELRQGPNGTLIDLRLDGLPHGMKAIHIHAVGNCDDHDHGFMDSSGHLNPDNKSHGLMNADGPDAGDFPNFYAHFDGVARAQLFNERASLDGSIGARILDDDGAALLIHENPDDHLTQPIGGAGRRIACGVIEAL